MQLEIGPNFGIFRYFYGKFFAVLTSFDTCVPSASLSPICYCVRAFKVACGAQTLFLPPTLCSCGTDCHAVLLPTFPKYGAELLGPNMTYYTPVSNVATKCTVLHTCTACTAAAAVIPCDLRSCVLITQWRVQHPRTRDQPQALGSGSLVEWVCVLSDCVLRSACVLQHVRCGSLARIHQQSRSVVAPSPLLRVRSWRVANHTLSRGTSW